jgi:hypothetical protein
MTPRRAALQARQQLEELVLASEYLADGVVREDPPDGVREDVRAGQLADQAGRTVAKRDRVGDEDPRERRGGERLVRPA